MSEHDNDKLFQQGVAAIRAGDKAKARELLVQVVEQNQLHEEAWLWLSAVVETNDERIVCLQNVLTINPRNERAIKGMQKLGAPLSESAQKYAQAPDPTPEPDASSQPLQGADKRPDWLRGMSGDFIAKPEDQAAAPKVEEGWRKKLAEEGTYTADAIYVYDKEVPTRNFNDLANSWLSAMIFKIPGDYQDEVDYGSMGHILINVAMSVLLQLIALAVPLIIFVLLQRSPAYLFQPFIDSSQEMSNTMGRLSAMRAVPESMQPLVGMLFPAAGQSVRIPVLTPAIMGAIASFMLAAGVASTLGSFVILLVQSMVVSRVAEGLKGKGNVFQTSLALSIAMVTTQIAYLPLAFLTPVLPFTGVAILSGVISLYGFLQNSTAVDAAHRMGIPLSMGVVVLSNVAIGVLFPCLLGIVFFVASGFAR